MNILCVHLFRCSRRNFAEKSVSFVNISHSFVRAYKMAQRTRMTERYSYACAAPTGTQSLFHSQFVRGLTHIWNFLFCALFLFRKHTTNKPMLAIKHQTQSKWQFYICSVWHSWLMLLFMFTQTITFVRSKYTIQLWGNRSFPPSACYKYSIFIFIFLLSPNALVI